MALTNFKKMGSVLRADFFYTVRNTVNTMMSEVLSVFLPKTPNKVLSSPANITIKHIQVSVKFVVTDKARPSQHPRMPSPLPVKEPCIGDGSHRPSGVRQRRTLQIQTQSDSRMENK